MAQSLAQHAKTKHKLNAREFHLSWLDHEGENGHGNNKENNCDTARAQGHDEDEDENQNGKDVKCPNKILMTEETQEGEDDDETMEDVENIEPKIEIVENRDWMNVPPTRVIHCKMCSEAVSEASFAGHLRMAHDSDKVGYAVMS